MPEADDKKKAGPNEELLKEIRDRFEYALQQWQRVRDEAATDIRFLSGQSWDPDELQARKDEGRPALNFDELNQYPNQLINQVRQNKRAVKVDPKGSGMNDKEAELRAGMIRDIEYASSAQAAYITGFESAAQRGIGFWGLRTEYADDTTFNQRIRIRRIANQDAVLIDPDFKEADASDITFAFIVEDIPRKEFKKRYPNAEVVDFSTEQMAMASKWIDEKRVQVAEYFQLTKERKRLLYVTLPGEQEKQLIFEETLPEGITYKDLKKAKLIERERWVETPKVMKYITNGIEILEEVEWAGIYIPLCVVFGKEIWVNYGSGPQRVLQSLIRLARDPQKLYNYYRTGESEEAGMTPKVPFIGAKGQFAGNLADWQNVGKVPKAFLEYNPILDSTGTTVLPPPARQPFQPNFQAYEVAADSARRAVMSAVGVSSLPTSAQRLNEKSGVALERIQASAQLGSFNFVDNFDRALEHNGKMIDDLLPKIYDMPQDIGIRNPDDSYKVVRINDDVEGAIRLTTGSGNVTISTGPSYESQRQEVEDFGELLAKIPGVFPQIADLLIKLKNLGPLGNEMADRLTPPQYRVKEGQKPLPPEAIAQMGQLTQQLQALDAFSKQLQAEVERLNKEKEAKIIDNQAKMEIEKMKAEVSVAIAEINTKAQEVATRMKYENDIWLKTHGFATDATLQIGQQEHEKEMAAAAAVVPPPMAAAEPAAGAPQAGA